MYILIYSFPMVMAKEKVLVGFTTNQDRCKYIENSIIESLSVYALCVHLAFQQV